MNGYKNKKRGKHLEVDTNSIIEILKDINGYIQTISLTLELSDMDEVNNTIELAQELSLKFTYTLQRRITFCGVIIWSDGINKERTIGTTVIPLETFLLDEIYRILELINKIMLKAAY